MPRSFARSALYAGLAAGALVAAAAPARAQDADAMRQKFLLPIASSQTGLDAFTGIFTGGPAISTATPVAFGPAMGEGFVGISYQSRLRTTKAANGAWNLDNQRADGSVSGGVGFGDASDLVGFSVMATSLSTFHNGFADRIAFSMQASRNIDPSLAVAVGVENGFISSGADARGTNSWYGVATKVFRSPLAGQPWWSAVTVSAGIGNGRFRMIDDMTKNNATVNGFGSIAAVVHDQVSLIAEYTGQDINIGASIVPFRQFPIVITPAVADLTGTANKGARFILGSGLALKF